MKIVLQRVSSAFVEITDEPIQKIEAGLLAFVGITAGDTPEISRFMAEKTANLRIFEDAASNMNLSLLDTGGDILIISNFTLYANCRKGRRPSFTEAARPDFAVPLYEAFIKDIKNTGINIKTGIFGADMKITAVNDGPVTIVLDSKDIYSR